jgi:DMSO/TMAO reductase YedYZ heme-binding membrane subunit
MNWITCIGLLLLLKAVDIFQTVRYDLRFVSPVANCAFVLCVLHNYAYLVVA